MSFEIILITHRKIGEELLATAQEIFGYKLPVPCLAIEIYPNSQIEAVGSHLKFLVQEKVKQKEVLVLTDLCGATPCNLAQQLLPHDRIAVISGVNLPMLVKVLNYPTLALNAVVDKALSSTDCIRVLTTAQ